MLPPNNEDKSKLEKKSDGVKESVSQSIIKGAAEIKINSAQDQEEEELKDENHKESRGFLDKDTMSKIQSNLIVQTMLTGAKGGCVRKLVYCVHTTKYFYINKVNQPVSGVSFTLMDVEVSSQEDGKGYYIQRYSISTPHPDKYYKEFPLNEMPVLMVADLRLPDRSGGNVTLISFRKLSNLVSSILD
jgi:hypothetical protein